APTQNFSPGDAPGAWELAARYSSIDLSDGSIVGGEGKTITLGSNWYPNRNVRVMLDWTRVLESDDSTRAAAAGLDVRTLRAQLTGSARGRLLSSSIIMCLLQKFGPPHMAAFLQSATEIPPEG